MSEPRNADLERVIVENPDDEAAFRVYGDWLLSQGHPRGELVSLCRSNAQVAPQHIDAFVAAHPEVWGELRPHGAVVQGARWRLGFIDAVSLVDRKSHPSWGPNGGHPALVLHKLLDGPGRFVRSLTFELSVYGADEIVAAIAKRGIATLSTLEIHDTYRKPVVGGTPLFAALPRLERLHVCGSVVKMRELAAPRLRELVLLGGLNRRTAKAIAEAHLPALETLRLAAHAGWRDGAAIGEALAPLLAGDRVPRLRHLALTHLLDRDAVVADLARSPMVRGLETLDLSHGHLDARDLDALAAAGLAERTTFAGNPGVTIAGP